MDYTRKIAIAAVLVFSAAVLGAEPAQDPFLGRWVLDTKASKYPGRTCPKRMLIEMKMEARGIHYHSETEPAVGEPFQVDYIANYDGKPAIVTGDRGLLLPVTLRQQSANQVKATYSNGFQVMASSDRVLSSDGRLMTITTISHDAFGGTQTSTGIYRRTGSLATQP